MSSKTPKMQRSHSAPHTRSQQMRQTLAALCIQKFARASMATRRSRALRGKWPTLEMLHRRREELRSRLRRMYLDSEAVAAGARDSSLYTDEYLVLRELCRSDPAVQAALTRAWEACAQGEEMMSKTAYLSMARRIYLVLAMRMGTPNSTECREISEKDWERDANGKDHLTRAEFFSSWFQLTDVNTIGVQAGEYAAFILRMTDRIARVRTVDGRLVGGYEWRDDRAIWAESSVDRVLTRHAQKKAAAALRSHASPRSKGTEAEQADPEYTAKPPTSQAPNSVFARLQCLTSFEAARKVEQANEARRARLDIERVSERAPADGSSWAALTRGRPRGLIAQHLASSAASSSSQHTVPPPLSGGSLVSTLVRARAEAMAANRQSRASILATPRRRARGLSVDQLPPLLRDGDAAEKNSHSDATHSEEENSFSAPSAPAAAPTAAPSPRAAKAARRAASPPVPSALVRIISGEECLPDGAAAA